MIKTMLDKAGAEAFIARWHRVKVFEREELRATPMKTKLLQLASLMASVEALGWKDVLTEGEEEIQRRWQHLRALLRA
jgi:hypothetical protein